MPIFQSHFLHRSIAERDQKPGRGQHGTPGVGNNGQRQPLSQDIIVLLCNNKAGRLRGEKDKKKYGVLLDGTRSSFCHLRPGIASEGLRSYSRGLHAGYNKATGGQFRKEMGQCALSAVGIKLKNEDKEKLCWSLSFEPIYWAMIVTALATDVG